MALTAEDCEAVRLALTDRWQTVREICAQVYPDCTASDLDRVRSRLAWLKANHPGHVRMRTYSGVGGNPGVWRWRP
jgi:hypothetical protein